MSFETANMFPSRRVQPTLFSLGDVIAENFEIRAVLGSGGMGQVFDAHDRLLNRRVAIKAHWPHLHTFPIHKEAQALAAIRHPSVVTVHSVGTHRGVEFMVMERILGTTLAEHLDRRWAHGPYPIDEAIEILARLADGLRAVHDAGLAHRDVKPANVMLAPGGRLVLTDFGIYLAEFSAQDAESAPGTADYMAPESIARVVVRGAAYLADVYAFGVLAFELVTGRRPFAAPSADAILEKQLREPAPRVASLRSDVPPRLAALIEAALQKDPAERPQSMEQIASMLRARDIACRPVRPIDVLIAEDDRTIADILEEFVGDSVPGANVRVARDGEAVLAYVRQSQPDLLLLDLGLPSMNGIELCMYLRGAGLAHETSIVAVSASAVAPDKALLTRLGIDGYIRKGNDWLDRIGQVLTRTRPSAPPRAASVR